MRILEGLETSLHLLVIVSIPISLNIPIYATCISHARAMQYKASWIPPQPEHHLLINHKHLLLYSQITSSTLTPIQTNHYIHQNGSSHFHSHSYSRRRFAQW